MNTINLALRNLWRNHRRSLTTLLAMIVGAVSILLFGGYSGNINYGLQSGFVQHSGHLQIQHKDYFLYGSGNPAAYGIPNYQHIIDVVQNDAVLKPMLTVVTPTLNLGGIAGNFSQGVSRTVIGAGVVIDDQNRMRRWNDYGFPYHFKSLALTGTSPDSAVIGTGVARVLQLCGPLQVKHCPQAPAKVVTDGARAPDDIAALSAQEASGQPAQADTHIELLAANAHGAPNVAGLNVVKAELQGVKELDDLYVMLHLQQAQKLVYGGDAPQATAVVLQLQHTSQLPAARARLEELLRTTLKGEALEVHDFATLNPSYGQITGMFAAIFGFIAILIGAIVLFTVGNTMSMAVVERTVEIGTLRAIGLRRGGIRRLFVTEGLLLGVIGSVLGVLAALALAWLINHGGLTWTPPGNVEPVPLMVRVWGEARMIVGTAIGLTVVAVLSAWWPARRAARLEIVDALRHV
ncbi:putative ABC transport system permease protein [Andreprevotia lacus DSM 23236]|jgi:putative ABC transport system permease protein|uniref:Putative ABC transport system permease protein n=1 Tax=Andreprevotia lacus DSM 23236 TaxID=1121001 RepID=A0A1W1XTN8_9NEIS|nr:FtsX-like permease family protein [Andreprevotia lacus]SMC27323.1 putative ABC transport system permease protein [Andreprevotia lacus DSM 23236]